MAMVVFVYSTYELSDLGKFNINKGDILQSNAESHLNNEDDERIDFPNNILHRDAAGGAYGNALDSISDESFKDLSKKHDGKEPLNARKLEMAAMSGDSLSIVNYLRNIKEHKLNTTTEAVSTSTTAEYTTESTTTSSVDGVQNRVANLLTDESLNPHTANTGGSDVLLVAYMRTGSTFLGKVLGWRDDVFYWFEPLMKGRSWNYLRGYDLLCSSLSPTCTIERQTSPVSSKPAIEFIEDIFSCRLQNHSDRPTRANFNKPLAPPNWSNFLNCAGPFNENILPKSRKCMPHLEQACGASTHRVAKVLRMDLDRISDMLETNPKLKIVMLFRDPRGSLNSHYHTSWYKIAFKTPSTTAKNCQVLCSRLINDIRKGKQLLKLYPNRFKIVQYEDMGEDYAKVKVLYEFLGMDASSKYEKFVSSIYEAPAGMDKSGGFHPFSYRTSLPWNIVKSANLYCRDVYKELGFRPFNSEQELKDLKINPVIDKLPFSILGV